MRNLLLVVMDTARADHFEPWGAPAGSTPVAADLARRGTAPRLAIAPSNWTFPSHASMFTGMLPSALGIATSTKLPPGPDIHPAVRMKAQSDRMLAEVLRRRGYATAGISANAWIRPVWGMGIGFDRFVGIDGTRKWPAKKLRSRLEWAVDVWRARADDGARQAGEILRGWMSELTTRAPFFWFVNLMECHGPYQPPRPFNDFGSLGRMLAGRDAALYQHLAGNLRVCIGESRMSEATIARTRRLYAGAIYQMDAWLGGIVEEMDRLGILEDTLVVLVSDHGENLGEQGLLGHMFSISERLLRVPLVFSAPVQIPTEGPVSLAELPALLAGGLGLGEHEHPWHDEVRPAGLAVSHVGGRQLPPPQLKQAEAVMSMEAINRLTSAMTSVTDGRLKLVRHNAGEHLFDLSSDPTESHPIDPAGVEAAAGFGAVIDHVDSLAPADENADDPPAATASSDETAELEERLRLLGYL